MIDVLNIPYSDWAVKINGKDIDTQVCNVRTVCVTRRHWGTRTWTPEGKCLNPHSLSMVVEISGLERTRMPSDCQVSWSLTFSVL